MWLDAPTKYHFSIIYLKEQPQESQIVCITEQMPLQTKKTATRSQIGVQVSVQYVIQADEIGPMQGLVCKGFLVTDKRPTIRMRTATEITFSTFLLFRNKA